MAAPPRSVRSLRPAVIAAALLLAAGCAATPRHVAQSPSASPGAQTPTSSPQLTAAVELATEAWKLGIPVKLTTRNGAIQYCWTDQTIGSNIPTTKCLDEPDMRDMVQARRETRDQMQTAPVGGPSYCGAPGSTSC